MAVWTFGPTDIFNHTQTQTQNVILCILNMILPCFLSDSNFVPKTYYVATHKSFTVHYYEKMVINNNSHKSIIY